MVVMLPLPPSSLQTHKRAPRFGCEADCRCTTLGGSELGWRNLCCTCIGHRRPYVIGWTNTEGLQRHPSIFYMTHHTYDKVHYVWMDELGG